MHKTSNKKNIKDQKSHIVFVTISDLIYEANVHRKVRSLLQAGHEVTVLASFSPDLNTNLWQGVHLQRLCLPKGPTMLRFFVFVLKAFFHLLRLKADLFVAYDYLPLMPLRLKSILQSCTYVYDSVELLAGLNSLVGRPVRKIFWLFYERLGLQKCAAAFTVCESDAQSLQKHYPKLNVAGFVRNIPQYKHPEYSSFLRDKFGILHEHKIGIYQGMIFKGRGLQEIIEACKNIEKITLVIVGDGPLLPALKEKAKSSGMEDRIIFTGLIPFQDLDRYTASADFGFTIISGKGLSYYHALPNKLFEYIQAEIPVIGSNYPEIAKIVEGEGIGFTVDAQNVKQIEQAVRQMLEPKIYLQFKEKLRSIGQRYTWRKEAQTYLKIIHSVISPGMVS